MYYKHKQTSVLSPPLSHTQKRHKHTKTHKFCTDSLRFLKRPPHLLSCFCYLIIRINTFLSLLIGTKKTCLEPNIYLNIITTCKLSSKVFKNGEMGIDLMKKTGDRIDRFDVEKYFSNNLSRSHLKLAFAV